MIDEDKLLIPLDPDEEIRVPRHYRRLRGLIHARSETLASVADYLMISRSAMNKKMNGHKDFTISEVKRMAEFLEVKPSKICTYICEDDY